ncbi:MAG: hypothetical protein K9N07_07100 [Candidatus Cloacimonetes bacterium]|nr:hypothetical protein [Candidatus Cloacimonadota bacterium]
MITKLEIINAQEKWGNYLVKIGSCKNDVIKCKKTTEQMIDKLYGYGKGTVLFCPTKAEKIQFRLTRRGAISYFIGNDNKFPEDRGFALTPWKKVRFENAGFILENNRALSMGNYFFTDLNDNVIKVEYTFGYFKDAEGELKIDLHHSALPYKIPKL